MKNQTKKKYTNLNQKAASRREYFEGHNYVNGVKNKAGHTVIRKLTPEEQDFLFRFESETLVADFNYHPEVKALIKKRKLLLQRAVNSSSILNKELKLLNRLRRKAEKVFATDASVENKNLLKSINWRIKCVTSGKYIKENREFLAAIFSLRIVKINNEIEQLKNEVCLYQDAPTANGDSRTSLFRENNQRNLDLMAHARATSKLLNIDIKQFDKFTSNHLSGISPENLLICEVDVELETAANESDDDSNENY